MVEQLQWVVSKCQLFHGIGQLSPVNDVSKLPDFVRSVVYPASETTQINQYAIYSYVYIIAYII